jgi:hypothetical protein
MTLPRSAYAGAYASLVNEAMGVEVLDLGQVSSLWLNTGTGLQQVCRLGCSVAEVKMDLSSLLNWVQRCCCP